IVSLVLIVFFFSSRRRHTRLVSDWSSDVCSSDLPGIRGVHRDVHHLGDLAAPLAHDAEALAVPARIGNDVDGDVDVDRARELEGLEVLGEAHPLAELAEALLVDRLDAEEHDLEAELGPELEDLLVAKEDVAAGLDVVALLDAPARDRLADRHAVLGLDEGDVVEDEEPGLADAGDLLHRALRRLHAIAPAVEGPGAAERAVPGTAPAELDGRARVELADEVLAAMAQEVARRQHGIEVANEHRLRPFAVGGDGAGNGGDRAPVVCHGLEQRRDRGLALAPQAAVDRTPGVLQ